MENSISLNEILNILKKRWKLITCSLFFVLLIVGNISYFILTPVYQASTQILVNQTDSENRFDINLLRSNIDLINTYSTIITGPVVLEKVIDELKLNESVEELNKKIKINSKENSQVFSLTAEDSSPDKAVEIANAISETFQKEISRIMNVNNVYILAKAQYKENPIPVKPNLIFNTMVAVVMGLMLGIGLAFLLEFMDSTLKVENDVVTHLGMPVLGTVQNISKSYKKRKGPKVQSLGSETVATEIEKN